MATGEVPQGANEHCPGTGAADAGRASACEGCPNQSACAAAPAGPDPDVSAVAARLARVRRVVLVLSGKGGVGKSTTAAQLAFALAAKGHEVGLLDVDICGPSVPKLLGLEGEEIHRSNAGWSPVYVEDNLGVMSIGFMLGDPDDAVVWRGPRKNALIKQFLLEVDWGALDYLVVDAPPGTSDEHISLAQYLSGKGVDGALVVTTPQEVALADVRKELNFCRKVGVPVLGVVENMCELQVPAGQCRFRDPTTGADRTAEALAALHAADPSLAAALVCADVFPPTQGGAAHVAQRWGVPVLGRVPLDPSLARAAEQGRSAFEEGSGVACAPALRALAEAVVAAVGGPTDAPMAE